MDFALINSYESLQFAVTRNLAKDYFPLKILRYARTRGTNRTIVNIYYDRTETMEFFQIVLGYYLKQEIDYLPTNISLILVTESLS